LVAMAKSLTDGPRSTTGCRRLMTCKKFLVGFIQTLLTQTCSGSRPTRMSCPARASNGAFPAPLSRR
jgi:hypothetical protein